MDIVGFFIGIFGQIGDWLNTALIGILSILPNSPFVYLQSNTTVSKYLGWLNWFLPIDFALATLELWLFAVGIFYIWQLLLRWVKAIN